MQASTMLDLALIALHRGETERVRELAGELPPGRRARTSRRPACASGRACSWRRPRSATTTRSPSASRAARPGPRAREHRDIPRAGCESAVAIGSAEALADVVALAEAATDRTAAVARGASGAAAREARGTARRARTAVRGGRRGAASDRGPVLGRVRAARAGGMVASRGRAGDVASLLAEARETFERLRVPPKLDAGRAGRGAVARGRDARTAT